MVFLEVNILRKPRLNFWRMIIFFACISGALAAEPSSISGNSVLTTEINLTDAERSWLMAHPEIRVAFDGDYAPYSFQNEQGEFEGIAVDFTRELVSRLGLQLQIHSNGDWRGLYDAAMQHEVDVVATLVRRPEREPYFEFTRPYISLAQYIITRSNDHNIQRREDIDGQRVALVEAYSTTEYILEQFPDIKPLYVPDLTSALEAVSTGVADVTVVAMGMAQHLIAQHGLTNLRFASLYAQGLSEQRFGVRKDWPELAIILNKVLATMSNQERIQIFQRWSQAKVAAVETVQPAEVILSEAELDWISDNPRIILGFSPDFEPHLIIGEQGQFTGILPEYYRRLEQITGLEIEILVKPWHDIVKQAREGKIDGLLACTSSQAKASGLTPLQNFYPVVPTFFSKNGIPLELNSLNDLVGKSVVYLRGIQVHQELLAPLDATVEIKLADRIIDVFTTVLEGKADFALALSSDIYALRKMGMSGVEPALIMTDNAFESFGCIREDWPELVSILNKGLSEIEPVERFQIQANWLGELVQAKFQRPKMDSTQLMNKTLLQMVLAFLLFFTIILVVLRWVGRGEQSRLNVQIIRRIVVVLNGLLIALVVFLVWWALGQVQRQVKDDMGESLLTVLETTQDSLLNWHADQRRYIAAVVADPQLLEYTRMLIDQHQNGGELQDSAIINQLRRYFQRRQSEIGALGFFIVAPDGTNLASRYIENVISQNLVQQQRPELLRRAFQGETVMIPPIKFDEPLAGVKPINGRDLPPTLFFAAPLRSSTGDVMAVLAQLLDPHDRFSQINRLGRLGETGETYVFDQKGVLLSESRFLDQIKQAGLVESDGQSILSIEIRDPGVNFTKGQISSLSRSKQPLTRMASNAVKGIAGLDLNGYRNYLGVPVIGAWQWVPGLGVGLTTEINLDEAMTTYRSARIVILVIAGATLVSALIFTVLVLVLGERASTNLRDSKELLEQRVSQRTQELQLAKGIAEEANNAKNQFLANVSHELRTPLNAVLGYTQLLQRDKNMQKPQLERVNAISRSGRHLLGLINDVLDFAKIESGTIEIKEEAFELNGLLTDIQTTFRSRVEQKGLIFEVELDENLPSWIRTDEQRLRQIMTNLLGNAVKFTHEGRVVLLVRQINMEILEIVVEDSGIGIEANRLDSIFNPFYKIDMGALSGGGSGLGLAISRDFARRLNGDIQCNSSPGQGSRFVLQLPLHKVTPGDVRKKISNPKIIGLREDQPAVRILVVDDQPENCDILKGLLLPLGFQIQTAADGVECLEKFRQWQPQVVLMDIVMPRMNGIQATREIRTLPEGTNALIIAVTASATPDQIDEMRELGTYEVIGKPFDLQRLLEAMEAHSEINYTYKNKTKANSVERRAKFEIMSFVQLPDPIQKKLAQAALLGDVGLAKEAVELIRPIDPNLANALLRLVHDYNFEQLEEIIKNGGL